MSRADNTGHAPKRCHGCFYRRSNGYGLSTCDFLYLTGIMRKCSPEKCEHYTTKTRGKKYREQRFNGRLLKEEN